MISDIERQAQDAERQRDYGSGQLSNTPYYINDINNQLKNIQQRLDKIMKSLDDKNII